MLAVGHRRRARHILLIVEAPLTHRPLSPRRAATDLPLPGDSPGLAIDAQEQQVAVFFLRGDEDHIVPNRRRGIAPTRQRRLPDDVLVLAPFGRQTLRR